MTAVSKSDADLFCTYCDYIGNIIIKKSWPSYVNPNYTIILNEHRIYLKWLILCPDAIKFVINQHIFIPCPICERTRLHISSNSTYSPEWIRSSLDCHKGISASHD